MAHTAPTRPLVARDLHRWVPANLLLPVLVGCGTGLVAAYAASDPRQPTALILVGAIFGASVAVIVGDIRRLLLALVLLDIPLQWDVYFGYRTDIDRLFALAGFGLSMTTLALLGLYAMWFVRLLVNPAEPPQPRLRPAAIPAIFLGLTGASIVVARDRTVSGFEITMLLQMLLLFIYLASTVRTRNDVRFIVTMLLVGLLLESLLTLVLFVLGTNFEFWGIGTRSRPTLDGTNSRVGGTIGAPNNAGAYFGFMATIAFALLMSPIRGALRRLALIASVPGVMALALTQSRGAWLAFVVSLLFVLVGLHSGRRLSPAAMVAFGLGVAILLIPLQGIIASRLLASDEGSAAGRVPLMEMALEMVRDHPLLGVGANNFVLALPDYAGGQFSAAWMAVVHNRFLLVWSQAGTGALLAFLLFVAVTIRRGWRARTLDDPLLAGVGLGLGAAVAGHAVHMNFDIFDGGTAEAMLWLSAGLLASPILTTRAITATGRGNRDFARTGPPWLSDPALPPDRRPRPLISARGSDHALPPHGPRR
jgi:putative inorganic carbon (hco3(-)) transporter